MTIIVTGGAGFIGSNFVNLWTNITEETVINIDKLTYAGNLDNLKGLQSNNNHIFKQIDICDLDAVSALIAEHKPRAIINFAAESHVDRSISNPEDFITTNVIGTFRLLEASKQYWDNLNNESEKQNFRFLHVSTDEVYGTLTPECPPFSETNPYQPNSPYSASKASSDHLVRAYYHTFGLPVLTTNCSNNYGPYQFPEKLIPLMINNALNGEKLPVYGDGLQIRDWLYVTDHCKAIIEVLEKGKLGEVYNIGGLNEKANIDIVNLICGTLDKKRPKADGSSYKEQIAYVTDRPGHDRRYAINADKIYNDLGWKPEETFATGIQKTIEWYLNNPDWIKKLINS